MREGVVSIAGAVATLGIVGVVFAVVQVPLSAVLIASGSGLGFAIVAYLLRFLTPSGAIAGGGLAASLIAVGGWVWVVPALAFFVLSSLLSQVGKRRKASAEAVSEKGSQRNIGQVLANGGVGWVLLLVYALDPAPIWYWGFLGAFAAATADTWETEIGTLAATQPRLLTTWKLVPKGTSGAVSVTGTLGGLLGAFVIWSLAASLAPEQVASVSGCLGIAGGGLLASFLDSLTGATVQARFLDPVTGEETERTEGGHLVRGWHWLRNDAVNGLCTFSGAAFAMACFRVADFAS